MWDRLSADICTILDNKGYVGAGQTDKYAYIQKEGRRQEHYELWLIR